MISSVTQWRLWSLASHCSWSARDLGVSKTALQTWVRDARFQPHRMSPSADADERREMSQALKRIRELEMENEVLYKAAEHLSQPHVRSPKQMGPLVQKLATRTGRKHIPVVVTCRVLGHTTQAYFKWLKNPVFARDIERQELIGKLLALPENDPDGGYRVLADALEDLGYQVSDRRMWRLCHKAEFRSVISKRRRKHSPAGPCGARRSCATRFHRRAAQPTVDARFLCRRRHKMSVTPKRFGVLAYRFSRSPACFPPVPGMVVRVLRPRIRRFMLSTRMSRFTVCWETSGSRCGIAGSHVPAFVRDLRF